MKRSVICTLAVVALCLAPVYAWAGSSRVATSKTYPAFQAGVTGAWVTIEPGPSMLVDRVDTDTPADGRLKPGDHILEVNGKVIGGDDPRRPLGEAIGEAEATTGSLRFAIERGGKRGTVVVRVPVLGRYSETWPLGCAKSKRIIDEQARHLAGSQNDEDLFGEAKGGGLTQSMAALFLLSTDDPAYTEHVKRYAHRLAASTASRPSTSVWHLGYHLIFLSEYYLKTGDASVIPALEAGCAEAARGQAAGGWAHHTTGQQPGYVQSGLMNSGGVTLFLGLTLARECGVSVHEEAYQRALKFFYRMVGHGSNPYGDHRALVTDAVNGRNAAVACAMSLLDQQPYTTAGQHLAMMVADSYFLHEGGHTGGGFNVLWRAIALPHVPEDEQSRTRRHMDELAWYYDLTRLPSGGFRMLPSPPDKQRYANDEWGHGVGLTYTAPLKTLRITGAPRTPHSKSTPKIDPLIWGTERDKVFLSTEHAEGFGQQTDPPHIIRTKLLSKDPVDVAYLAKMMRHYNPATRTQAAKKLGAMRTPASYDAIEAAIKNPDPRVRRAGCDAISNYNSFFNRGTSDIPKEIASKRFMPAINAILNDSESAWWEIDGAFWAMRGVLPEDIRHHREVIDRYADHDEWFLRESSYWALVGLGKDITGPEFLELAKRYNNSIAVFERNSMNSGIVQLVQRDRVDLDDDTIAKYVEMVATQLSDAMLAAGYDRSVARQEAAHRTMMVIADFNNPPYDLIAEQLAKYLEDWTPGDNQHANWLISGNKWQPGLAKIAKDLDKDAGPIVEQFERLLKRDDWSLKKNKRNLQSAANEAMQQAVEHYQALE